MDQELTVEPGDLYYIPDMWAVEEDGICPEIVTRRVESDWLIIDTPDDNGNVDVYLWETDEFFTLSESDVRSLLDSGYVGKMEFKNPLKSILTQGLLAQWNVYNGVDESKRTSMQTRDRRGSMNVKLITSTRDELHAMLDEWIDGMEKERTWSFPNEY